MQIQVWCRTDTGRRRDSNQDSYLINKDLGLFIVADGMGGHSGGEVASEMAVKTVEEFVGLYRNKGLAPRDLITRAYEEASRRIFDRAAQETRLMGMGTTMVLCYLHENSVFVANVGDSRVYLYSQPHFWQLTEDHSLMNEQLRAGVISEEQLKNFINKNVITRSVGYDRNVQVDILERPVQEGDYYLLCSDGFSGLVPDHLATEILNRTAPEKTVESCVDQALENGGDDNVTVMYLQVQSS